MAKEQFDYIVIGTGAAGSVVASRLSEDPNVSVLVLESGGNDWDPVIKIPKGFYFLYGGTRHSFTYKTKPVGPDGAIEIWQRGRVLGGSTAINGLQYERGGEHFWNQLEADGNPGWGWDDMLAAFRSFENHELGASDVRGSGGPLDLHVSRPEDELNERIFAAAEAYGLPRVDDINASDGERVGYIPNTVRNGFRLTAARAFLTPALKRKNLSLELNTHVSRILFDGTRATGVRARSGGVVRDFAATTEVIVCAGALDTPLLLERSGIGDPRILHGIGVPTVVDSPNVGEHAIEQRQVAYQASVSENIGYNQRLSSPLRQMLTGAKFLWSRQGVIGTGGYDIGAFYKTTPEKESADVIAIFNPLSMDLEASGLKVATHPGFSASAYLLHPTTESSVHSSGSLPDNPPVIESNYLDTEHDKAGIHAALLGTRAIASQGPLADITIAEEAPGDDVTSREDAIAHAWASGHILHGVGTARMGPDADAVVDPDLRVRGTDNVRIADTSVLPMQPGNTMGPTIAVGWRAADLILGRG